jgi:DNA-binding MarR family transcriptional regulator
MKAPPAHYRLRGMECLCGNVRMAARALTSVYDRFLEPAGLTSSQLAVLWCVLGREPVAMREVGEVLVMDKTTVSRNLAALGGHGLVAVRPGDDARVKLVVSTAKGRRAFASALPRWKAAQAWVERSVGKEPFAKAVRQSKRLAQSVSGRAAAR